MSKYRISVEEILDDGTTKPFFFDEAKTIPVIEGDGFIVAGAGISANKTLKHSTVAIHGLSNWMIAEILANNDALYRAADLSGLIRKVMKLAGSNTDGDNDKEAEDATD